MREETQGKIFRMIEEIYTKLQSELTIERRERESTTESLLHLLEETCNKIDRNLSG